MPNFLASPVWNCLLNLQGQISYGFDLNSISSTRYSFVENTMLWGASGGRGWCGGSRGLFNGTWGRGDKNSHWQVGRPPREGASDPGRGEHSVRWRRSKWRFGQDAQSLTHWHLL